MYNNISNAETGIVRKPADNGGEICIFNCTDYDKEAEHQLSDKVYHEKLMTNLNENDPIPLYKKKKWMTN